MTRPGDAAKRKTAIIAEDDMITRRLLRRLLEDLYLEVLEAADGEQLLTEHGRSNPHIIVSDIQMPNMDGLSACAEIRQRPNGTDLPIIIMSAHDDRETRRQAEALEIFSFIAKPIKLQSFKNQVTLALADGREPVATTADGRR